MESMVSKIFCVKIVTLFSLLMGVISFVIESLSRAVVNSLSEISSYITVSWRVDERNTAIADGKCQFPQLLNFQNLLYISNKFYKYVFDFVRFFLFIFIYKIIPHKKYPTVTSI